MSTFSQLRGVQRESFIAFVKRHERIMVYIIHFRQHKYCFLNVAQYQKTLQNAN